MQMETLNINPNPNIPTLISKAINQSNISAAA